VRLCVVGDGAPWIWNQIQAHFPQARQVLDYYHCCERLHRVATSLYGQSLKAQEWAEATLTRLYHGEVSQVIGGLKRMTARSEEATMRLPSSLTISTSIAIARAMGRCVVAVTRWAVGALNRPTSLSHTCGSSALVPGGM
jgi:hypothetical protein